MEWIFLLLLPFNVLVCKLKVGKVIHKNGYSKIKVESLSSPKVEAFQEWPEIILKNIDYYTPHMLHILYSINKKYNLVSTLS